MQFENDGIGGTMTPAGSHATRLGEHGAGTYSSPRGWVFPAGATTRRPVDRRGGRVTDDTEGTQAHTVPHKP